MARAIDANEMKKEILAIIEFRKQHHMDTNDYESFARFIDNQPTIDPVKDVYVSFGAYEQVRWERDVAIDQLNSYGVQLGEKAELQRVKHGKWRFSRVTVGHKIWECSVCEKTEITRTNYCPNCGTQMDGEADE